MARFEKKQGLKNGFGDDLPPITGIFAHDVDGKEGLLEKTGTFLGTSNPMVTSFVQTIRPGCEAVLITAHAGVSEYRVRLAEKSEEMADVYKEAGLEAPPVRRSVPLAIAQTFGFCSR